MKLLSTCTVHITGIQLIPQDWLPVGIRSWTPVYIEWSRSSKAGLNFRAAYEFIKDTYCGYHTTTKPEGEVNGGDLASSGLKLNQYYQQRCTWILDSLTDRQLTIEVKSTQSRKKSRSVRHHYTATLLPFSPKVALTIQISFPLVLVTGSPRSTIQFPALCQRVNALYKMCQRVEQAAR